MRVFVFPSQEGKEKNQTGKIIVVKNSRGDDVVKCWDQFLELCKLKLGIEKEKPIRCFLPNKSEATSLEELFPNDTLYITQELNETVQLSESPLIHLHEKIKEMEQKIYMLEEMFAIQQEHQQKQKQNEDVESDELTMESVFDVENEPILTINPSTGDRAINTKENGAKLSTTSATPDESYEQTTFVILINSKSGGQLGNSLVPKYKKLLGDANVYTLDEGPEKILEKYKGRQKVKVIVCGGDGSVKWVLETIDKLNMNPRPPVGVMPLGTGNDIARVFNWGGQWNNTSTDGIRKFVMQMHHSQGVNLDRWSVEITEVFNQNQVSAKKQFIMSNYFSFGIDAKIALGFHNLRNNHQSLFNNHAVNKFWYVACGAQSFVDSFIDMNSDVTKLVDIEVDDQKLLINDSYEGIVFLNIPSYAGGCDLWGSHNDPKFKPQSINDGMLEIVGIKSASHLASLRSGSSGIRISQGRKVSMFFKNPKKKSLAFQVDGEPWDQKYAASINITYHGQVKLLAKLNLQ